MNRRKELLFASSNRHKLEEIRKMIPDAYDLIGLEDIHWSVEIPEPFDSFEANAKAKTAFVFDSTGMACFADDSGLEVDSLDGRPGVRSARYAGEQKDSIENMNKVLNELGTQTRRSARFVAVIAYQLSANDVHVFTGRIEGSIAYAPSGKEGFGYDPIFIPSGFSESFGELPVALKNRISHRAIAMRKFLEFLSTH